MILDVEQFIRRREGDWSAFEALLERLESTDRGQVDLEASQRFHYLYERVAADLSKLKTYAVEPETRRYLEGLIARGFAEMHGGSRRLPLTRALAALFTVFPQTVRRHGVIFLWVLGIFTAGGLFGGLALALDPGAKAVLMPFAHLQGDPSERVAEEEAVENDPMAGGKSTFSAQLMTHNTRVAIFALALGMTFGFGTGVLLFYNGAILGAVAMDYILAGESIFLAGWLLPHGSVEIPAILLAGQGGLLIGRTMLFARGRLSFGERFRAIRVDLVVLISGVAVMLVWAGLVESFFSQYHEPIIPYAAKIAFGLGQLGLVGAYFLIIGRRAGGGERA